MLSCGADQHTTCCIHSSHHDPDTHVPEMDFDGASRQRGGSIKVLEVTSRFGIVQLRVHLVPVNAEGVP